MIKSTPLLWTILLYISAVFTIAGDDGWHLDYTTLLVNERLDPVVSPNSVSSHMHKVIGGSRFGASYSYEDQIASKCSSLRVQADKSNYWMPSLYWMDETTNQYIPLQAGIRFYYFMGRNSDSEVVSPFPEGLRMVAGDPNNKSPTSAGGYFCQRNQATGDTLYSSDFNFNSTCKDGMKSEVFFPPCWDGVNLYKSDQSHMAYPAGSVRSGPCPISHPVRLPAIMLEYTWYTNMYDPVSNMNGHLIWANGDTTGYGIHADFTNGWMTDVLRQALNSTACGIGGGNSIAMEQCPILNAYFDNNAAQNCKPEKGVLTESDGSNTDLTPLSALPGCNLPWGASGPKPTCDSTPPAPNVAPLTGTQGSEVTSTPTPYVLPTTPGWQPYVCTPDINSLTNQVSYPDQKLTASSCQASCLQGGYSYASVGLRGSTWICVCSKGIAGDARVSPGSCTTPCPGNATETCGANYLLQVYYAPAGTTAAPTFSTPSGANYAGCFGQAVPAVSTYSFSSSTMDWMTCNSACKAQGANWAAISYGRNCNCGKDWTPGTATWLPDRQCSSTCSGNSTQSCGAQFASTVFNLTSAVYKDTGPARLPGYVGCYGQESNNAGLTYGWGLGQMTQSACVNGCSELGYSVAGLRQGNQCFCGQKLSSNTVQPSSQCVTPCGGNSTSVCGGTYNFDIYNTTGYTTVATLGSGRPGKYLGCFKYSSTTFGNYSYTASSVDQESCASACAGFKYKYAGITNGNVCMCGTTPPNNYQAIASQSCTKNCFANTGETCGGSGFVDAYDLSSMVSGSPTTTAPTNSTGNSTSPTPGSVLAGNTTSGDITASLTCYTDVNAMTGPAYNADWMSPTVCANWCFGKGMAYAGVVNGNGCRCGNSPPKSLMPLSFCKATCTADSSGMCGTSSAIAVASIANQNLASNGFGLNPDSTGFLGCYQEQSTRILSNLVLTSGALNNTMCVQNCKALGYAFAGTYNGNQCYCGNTFNNTGSGYRIQTGDCYTKCSGGTDLCGSSGRTSIWDISKTPNNQLVTTPGTMGCYQTGSFATNAGFVYSVTGMTPQLCQATCTLKGFKYSATYASSTCACSNNQDYGAVVAYQTCSRPCNGDSSQRCGGYGSEINVFDNSLANSKVDTTGFTTGYLGCFVDQSSPRALPDYTYVNGGMTNLMCQRVCASQGYKTYGTEGGNQCYCSLNLPTTGLAPASACATTCYSSAEKCGGSWRISVYSSLASGTGTGNTSISVSASASSSAKASASSAAVNSSMPIISASVSSAKSSAVASSVTSVIASSAPSSVVKSTSSSAQASVTTSKASSIAASISTAPVSSSAAAVSSVTSKVSSAAASISTAPVSSSGAAASVTTKASSIAASISTAPVSSSAAASSSKASSVVASISTAPVSSSVTAVSSKASSVAASISTVPSSAAASVTTSKPVSVSTAAPSSVTKASSAAASSMTTASATKASTTASSAAPSASAVVPDGGLVGCFTQPTKVLSQVSLTVTPLSPPLCNVWCHANGYEYAGLNNGNFCGCASDLSTLTQVAASQCNVQCTGNTALSCGGQTAFTVYKSSASITLAKRSEVKAYHGGRVVRKNRGRTQVW